MAAKSGTFSMVLVLALVFVVKAMIRKEPGSTRRQEDRRSSETMEVVITDASEHLVTPQHVIKGTNTNSIRRVGNHASEGVQVALDSNAMVSIADDTLGDNSDKQATECGANKKVVDHVCVVCPAGKISNGSHDASGGNTTCHLPPINLGVAGSFALLTKTGVTTTGLTHVTGDMGVSPAASTYLTGFLLILAPSSTFSTSTLVNGRVYAASYTAPTPAMMTTAISNMETAYTEAAGRVGPDTTESGIAGHPGNIEGMSPEGGLHKWSSSVRFSNSLYFDAGGNPDTVWIMQIAQNLVLDPGARVTLQNGAKASNIFWQIAEQTQIPADAHLEGIILCKTAIIFGSNSSLNGRGLAQTLVTMIATTIVAPQP